MKKHIKRISLIIVCIILLLVGSFCIYYFSRFRTLSSIQKVTSYEDGYNLYQIDIKYDYDLDQIIDYGITDNQSMIDAIIKEALPLLPVKIKAPDFGCTAFTMTDNQNQVHMGRNYDFTCSVCRARHWLRILCATSTTSTSSACSHRTFISPRIRRWLPPVQKRWICWSHDCSA